MKPTQQLNDRYPVVSADQLSLREGSFKSPIQRRACSTSVSHWWRAVYCLQALWSGQSRFPFHLLRTGTSEVVSCCCSHVLHGTFSSSGSLWTLFIGCAIVIDPNLTDMCLVCLAMFSVACAGLSCSGYHYWSRGTWRWQSSDHQVWSPGNIIMASLHTLNRGTLVTRGYSSVSFRVYCAVSESGPRYVIVVGHSNFLLTTISTRSAWCSKCVDFVCVFLVHPGEKNLEQRIFFRWFCANLPCHYRILFSFPCSPVTCEFWNVHSAPILLHLRSPVAVPMSFSWKLKNYKNYVSFSLQIWYWHDEMYLLRLLPRSMPCGRHCWRSQLWIHHRDSWGEYYWSLSLEGYCGTLHLSCSILLLARTIVLRSSSERWCHWLYCFLTGSLFVQFLLGTGIIVWQGEAPRKWWPLGNRNSWEPSIWKPISLIPFFADGVFLRGKFLVISWIKCLVGAYFKKFCRTEVLESNLVVLQLRWKCSRLTGLACSCFKVSRWLWVVNSFSFKCCSISCSKMAWNQGESFPL